MTDFFNTWNLFNDVPVFIAVLFWIALAVALINVISSVVLISSALRFRRNLRRDDKRRSRRNQGEGLDGNEYLWVFVVPALNEEVTIADSVRRLHETAMENIVILVVNDGSEDATGEILETIQAPALQVLTRVLPDAQNGKAAALNDAFWHINEVLLASPQYSHWSKDRIILAVVDADGRLDEDAPAAVARHFSDPLIGGVQCLVRIYNRKGLLTWAQDVEFSTFGKVFQIGRAGWGGANMGGNGQFNRFSALESIVDGEGPWRNRLTEDQDLGVRLIQSGWKGAQEDSVAIHQQGLSNIRRLYRQRTRWAQGAWQALSLVPGVLKLRAGSLVSRVDMWLYLVSPILQLVTGLGFAIALVLASVQHVPFWPDYLPVIFFFGAVGFGPGLAALLFRQRSVGNVFRAGLLIIPYTLYTWVLFPVLVLGLFRHLSGHDSWAKTDREPMELEWDHSDMLVEWERILAPNNYSGSLSDSSETIVTGNPGRHARYR